MKKLIISLIFIFIVNITNAQLKIAVSSGYQYPFSKSVMSASVYGLNTNINNSNNANDHLHDFIKGSLGSGNSYQFAIGYLFNKNISLDLNIGYNNNSKFTLHVVNGDANAYNDKLYTIQAKDYILFTPNITYYYFNKSKVSSYINFGLVLATNGYVNYSLTLKSKEDNEPENIYEREWKAITKFRPGLKTNIGIQYALKKYFKIFAELNSTNMNLNYKNASMTKYTINGFDKMPSTYTSIKEIEYVDNLEGDLNNSINVPTKVVGLNNNFSTIGFSIGCSFVF